MYQGGVTFSETGEKCPRFSPLTLTGVLKAPVQGEEVERTRKRKMTTSELQGEVVPTVEERLETEKKKGRGGGGGGGVEDYPKQPVLSFKAEEDTIPA